MDIKQAVSNNRTISKVSAKAYKAAPTIAFVAGAIGSVASLYLMWSAARKHEEIVSDAIDIIEEVHDKKPDENGENENALPMKDYRKELVKAYIKAGFKIGKLYAPVAVAEIASIGLMSLGYGQLNGRYISTLAACSLLEREYAKYRQNVVENLGDDIDRQFRFGLKEKELEVPELDKNGNPKVDKNGVVKTKVVKQQVLEDDMEGYSGYARIFDKQHCKNFDSYENTGMATSWYNREFLINQENFFNMLLKYRPSHTVFLNEVYEALGYEPTKEGQVVGWHYDPDHPIGDNKIIFVPIEFYNEKYEAKSVILDFNVDGNVWEFL